MVINNTGTPQTATATQQTGGPDAESLVVQIMMKDLGTNGPISQGIAGLVGLF